MVHYALCQCLFIYCVTSWGGVAKSHLSQLERAQANILKVATLNLCFALPRTSTNNAKLYLYVSYSTAHRLKKSILWFLMMLLCLIETDAMV